jgi:hypothetical protein
MTDSRSRRAWGPQPLPRLDVRVGQRPTSTPQSPRHTEEECWPRQRERPEGDARPDQAARRREADELAPAAPLSAVRVAPTSPPEVLRALQVARGLACEAVWTSLRDEVVGPLLPGLVKEAIRGVLVTRVPLRRKPIAETGRAAVAEEIRALVIANVLADEARWVQRPRTAHLPRRALARERSRTVAAGSGENREPALPVAECTSR